MATLSVAWRFQSGWRIISAGTFTGLRWEVVGLGFNVFLGGERNTIASEGIICSKAEGSGSPTDLCVVWVAED